MLQRAASNAYSWWWASHIRTKQSKWLEQCLQDMEEKVQNMLKLIEEDGDSFIKRAEMYYKRRPELISNIEESYKSFRALADRYDHLSKELQNANHTIATVIPDQVQFAIDEDDDCPNPKFTKTPPPGQMTPQRISGNIPTPPTQDIKALISTASRQFKDKKALKSQSSAKNNVVKSGLNKDEAVKEIDRLQKEILALQTVKEFVKSSYESGVAKYWELENQIMEMQQRACSLRDEFDVDMMIEDDDARTLMAQAALKSCQETLAILEAAQEKSTREAREEYQRIEAAWERVKSITRKYSREKNNDDDDDKTAASGDYGDVIHDAVEEIQKNPNESFNWSNMGSLTASELAEKVEQLVNKVIDLETAVSSQNVLVHTLRTETDDLNEQIRDLEDGNEALVDDVHGLGTKVKEVEERLSKVQDLNKNLERKSSTLQTTFAEARSDIDCLSEKLSSIKPDEDESEETSYSTREVDDASEEKQGGLKDLDLAPSDLEHKDTEYVKEVDANASEGLEKSASGKTEDKKEIKKSATFLERKLNELVTEGSNKSTIKFEEQEFRNRVEEIDWNQILLSGMEDREKILLKEYTVMLRNYREVKKKLSDMEKKEKDSQFDVTLQMRELKKAILKRDEEIQILQQRIGLVQGDKDLGEDSSPLCKREVGLNENEDADTPISDDEDDMKMVFIDKTEPISVVEEKFRYKIDAILDENLDFWLRFSSAFHQVQKFRTEVEDLQDEISKLKEKKKQDGIATIQIRSEIRPIYKHLREIQTELSVWLEQSASLKDELKRRFASLCSIQEEMTTALKEGVEEEEIKFSTHQAAKFQGEILNMKQENSKVREELRAGLDHASMLQLEIEKTLRKLSEDFGITNDQTENMTRARIPLKSFLFGTKPKRKHSIFSHMQPNRRYQILRAGIHLSKFNS